MLLLWGMLEDYGGTEVVFPGLENNITTINSDGSRVDVSNANNNLIRSNSYNHLIY